MMRGRRRRKYKSGMGFVLITVLVLFAVITFERVQLDAKDSSLKAEKARLEQQLDDANTDTEGIESYREYVKSDDYIENEAREKLGLVYPDEVIFEPKDK